MTNNPKLSIVIPWCDRDEVQRTFLHNRTIFRECEAEVLIINCGGDLHRLRRCLASIELEMLRVIEIPRPTFNKSLAINIGVHSSRSPRLFVLDADICLNRNFISEAVSHLEREAFVTIGRIYESESKHNYVTSALSRDLKGEFVTSLSLGNFIQISFADGTSVELRHPEDPFDNSRCAPGLIFANIDHIASIQGYNSDLEGWGWEDDDVQLRLRKVLGLAHVEIGEALHLSHGDERRALFGASRWSSNISNFRLACRRYSLGDFHGTYSIDISTWKNKIREVRF